MERTRSDVLSSTTQDYLATLDIVNPPTAKIIEAELLDKIRFEFEIENAVKPKNRQWRILLELEPFIIARIILRLNHVRRLLWSGVAQDNNYSLMMYQTDGPYCGVHTEDLTLIKNLIRTYNESILERSISEVINVLIDQAPFCYLTSDPDLIAVNNGVFDYKTKTLLPFSPDYVFISKSEVKYNPSARNPIIHNLDDGSDWDVESWLDDLSDDEGVPELLWQTIGSIIRPGVEWNKVVCFYSEQGNNGKGTLCELMRNLCGKESHASIPFANFAREFMLEQLLHISAVIVDENDTNDFTKVAAALKAVITGDYLTINRKFQKPITLRFNGVMVQCINDLPKFGDKSESLYRRFLLIPFTKCFTGSERKYIKADYLNRQDVLEYVLFKVLHMAYYSFSEPDVCMDLKSEYKINNDPIRQFLDDILPDLVWDLVPYQFLYDLYKVWGSKNNPSGRMVSKQGFTKQVRNVLVGNTMWLADDKARPTRALMDSPEYLIATYNLTEWMNSSYKGSDKNLLCIPEKKSSYRGMVRL